MMRSAARRRETTHHANDEGPQRGGSGGPFPEHAHAEQHGNGGREIALHVLQVQVQRHVEVFDHQHPADADEDNHRRGDAAHDYLGFAGGGRMPFPIEVHGEERGGSVELGTQRRHQRDDHAAGHHAAKAVRQNLRHERGVGGVTAGAETDARRLGQRKGNHARHQEDEHRRQFEEAGEDGAAPRFLLVFAGEHALDDILIGTPIPETNDGRAGQNRQPGPVGIIDGSDEMNIVAE